MRVPLVPLRLLVLNKPPRWYAHATQVTAGQWLAVQLLYVLFFLSCTILQFIFVCIVFFYWTDTKTPHAPRRANESGGSRHFVSPAAPQDKMAPLLIRWLIPPVPPSCPRPVPPVHPVLASHFIPFYHPVPQNPMYLRKPIS